MIERINQAIYRVLKWSERYTKTDMVYLYEGGGLLGLSAILSGVSTLLLAIGFANLVSKETYGAYRYLLGAVGVLSIPTLHGINIALIQTVAAGNHGSLSLVRKTKLKWGILTSVSSIAVALYYLSIGNTNLAFGFMLVAVTLPIIEENAATDSYVIGRELYKVSTIYRIILDVVRTLGIFITILLSDSILLIFLVYFLSQVVVTTIYYRLVLSMYPPSNEVDENVVGYGKHLTATELIVTIAAYLDRLIIFNLLGAEELAIYSFALAPPEQIRGILKIIDVMALTRFSKRGVGEVEQTIFGKVVRFSVILLVITGGYILIAPTIYNLLFPEYTSSIRYSQVFSLSLAAFAYYLPFSLFKSQRMVEKIYKFNTVT